MTDAPTPEASWSDLIERTIARRVERAIQDERLRLAATLRSIEEQSFQRGYAKAVEDADAVIAAALGSLARGARDGSKLSYGRLTDAWLKGEASAG